MTHGADQIAEAAHGLPPCGIALSDGLGHMVTERATPCPHCGSVACANGGGGMSGYWVIHPGCDKAREAAYQDGMTPEDDKRFNRQWDVK